MMRTPVSLLEGSARKANYGHSPSLLKAASDQWSSSDAYDGSNTSLSTYR